MANKSTQNNYSPNSRGYSPFVVDLRQAASKFEKEIKKEEKTIRKELKEKYRDLKPSLATLENHNFFSFLKWTPQEKKIKERIEKEVKEKSRAKIEEKKENKKAADFYQTGKSLADIILKKEKDFALALKIKLPKNKTQKALALAQEKVVWYRSVLAFFIVLCLLIMPFKILAYFDLFNLRNLEAKIVSRSQLAMTSLMAASNSVSKMDFKAADSNFKNAGENFLAAQTELNLISDSILSLASLSNNPKIKLAAESKNFLEAGAIASSLGHNLVLASDSLFSGDKNDFPLVLNNFTTYGQSAVSDANDLKKVLGKINVNNLPEEYQAKFISLNNQVVLLSSGLANFVDAGTNLKEALGLTHDKRYLLVFQNNSELRASGGFLGSYALVDFRDGKIRNLEVPGGGSYDTEAGLNMRIVAPQALWLVNPLWHFWDANWWPDWPTTAKNLEWFYEKSGGPSVDGVISITPTVIERLLEITGPIDMTKEYGVVIDSNNFWEITQKIVEQKNLAKTNPEYVAGLATTSDVVKSDLPLQQGLDTNSANKPKKIIGDLMVKILEVLPQKLNKDNLVNILTAFESNLAEKQILFYFNDPVAQEAVSSRNFAGEIKDTNKDYLLLVNTNIAGQKTDRKIVENVDETSEVSADGTIINTLKITRTHTGIKNEPLVGVRNVDWMRIYVPLGSELISASGFNAPDSKYLDKKPASDWVKIPQLANEENAVIDSKSGTKIYPENNKTVFANWSMVDPGQSTEVVIKYRLPFNLFTKQVSSGWLDKINKILNPDKKETLGYSLLLQKQPGALPDNFSSHLFLPAGSNIFWHYPADLKTNQGWELNTLLNSDKYWSVLMTNN